MKEEIEKLISEYLDGELNGEKEKELFEELAENREAREFLKKASLLRTAVASDEEELPEKTDYLITKEVFEKFVSHEHPVRTRKRITELAVFAVAAAVVLFGLLFFSTMKDYEKEITELKRIARYQNKTIETIVNGLPEIKVKGKLRNEVIIQRKL